jgi:hypothetical protein
MDSIKWISVCDREPETERIEWKYDRNAHCYSKPLLLHGGDDQMCEGHLYVAMDEDGELVDCQWQSLDGEPIDDVTHWAFKD